MSDEQHSEERLEPPDRIWLLRNEDGSLDDHWQMSTLSGTRDVEYVRASIAAPQKDLRIRDREGNVVTQGAFNALMVRVDSLTEDAELAAEDADRLRGELGTVYANMLRAAPGSKCMLCGHEQRFYNAEADACEHTTGLTQAQFDMFCGCACRFAAPSVTAPVSTAEQDGWVTFGRVKVDIENETETFERIYPPTAATSEAIRAAAYDVVGLELLRVDRVEEILSRYFGKGETDAGFVEVFRDTAIKCHFGYRHEGPWDTCEWIECEDRRMLIQSFTAAPGSPSPAEPLLSDDDAALTAHAIRVARAVQEFIWADCYPSLRPYDAEGWRQLFQKRVDCIAGVDLSRHGGLPVLRKRLLQQAALSIKALALVNRWAKSRATASLDGTDLKQTAALRTSVGEESK